MKYEWEEQDIIVGRRVESPNRSEQYMIGYDPSSISSNNLILVSLLDGMMTTSSISKGNMAIHFNECKMIPMSLDEELK